MGGGGAIRTATKLAGISTLTTPFRSFTNPPSSTAARPVSATVCDGGVKLDQSIQRPASELEDWEIASCFENDQQQYQKQQKYEEDDDEFLLVSDKYGYGDRIVFGAVPTFEETKEATLELKHALEMVYHSSPKSSVSVGSLSSVHETKACITHESSASKGALQAFKLLKENPAAQTVVASIASDPNVWTAVLQNPALMEFLESEKKYDNAKTQESLKTPIDATSSKRSINIDAAEEQGKSDGFMGLLKDVKVTVVDMVSKLTSFVESLFSVPDVEKKGETSDDSTKNFLAGGTFMALAMMVIMVVLMKRN